MNDRIIIYINDFVKNYKSLKNTEFSWNEPVVGFAKADDPLFQKLKDVANPSHALPSDLLPGAQSVIAFFIPFEKKVVMSNIGDEESSRAWDIASIETNKLIEDLNKHLHYKIQEWGFNSTLLPATYNYDEKKLISDWSHRHVAYIAGVGTFGIHNMLITDRGCCGRIGSVVTNLVLEPTKRGTVENCLFKFNGSCKKCVERCVNDAFFIENETYSCDRQKCNEQIYEKIVPVYPIGLGDTCGKCMCGVPCSFNNPVKKFTKPNQI